MQRRHFLSATGTAAGFTILPSGLLAAAPNAKLRIAHVGVGGKGKSDLSEMALHKRAEIAALCDVDARQLDGAAKKHPNAKTFRDYREMIATMAESIDAVVVSTPDHTHAPAAAMAMKLGKPVYCQKPLTHNIVEARYLRELSEKTGLATQMGIQIHSSREYRSAVEIIQSGAIGKVKTVHAWSPKGWGYDGQVPKGSDPVPDSLDWNLWLGCAAERPYKKGFYHPGQWRKLLDFGCGTLGDMGVHIFDTPFTALALTDPNWVKNSCRPPTGVGHPLKNRVEYEFPETKYTDGPLQWIWYDGGGAPPKIPDLALPGDWKLPGQGAMFVGQHGRMLLPHVGGPRLFPEEKFADFKRPRLKTNDHYHQWIDACLGEDSCSADFTFSGKLTEAILLGVVANRFPDVKLDWDAKNLRITNESAANQYLRRDYRDGFGVTGLG